ncbi:ABC transporter ATP-binding protein [Hymenobacter ginkgonis]|uniref:ABC transporter ATP-binding protein n=1 Tax=Hymenobacter ginkgonis TaxID=2682976 RepID=UPI001E28A5EC|nr:ABC transporter ATP-binding protein [Hymenobacter ginkgonis]
MLTAPQSLFVENLIAGYADKVLLRDFSLALPPTPSFVAVLGHNGAGKTTLFRVLTGQLPYQGSVQLGGPEELRTLSGPRLARRLGYLPQRGSLDFSLSVRELVVMGRYRHHGLFSTYKLADYARADAALAQVGATHLAKQDFRQLSGGEQQLVWLAQLSLQDAPLYLLDEPTQQLDVYHRRRIFELLNTWVATENKTILCSTHDLDSLPPLAGYLLNISRPRPQLVPISLESVRAEREFLERGPA